MLHTYIPSQKIRLFRKSPIFFHYCLSVILIIVALHYEGILDPNGGTTMESTLIAQAVLPVTSIKLFSEKIIFSRYPTIVQVYGFEPFDPEGILGCLTSIFQKFLGLQAGTILKVHRGWKNRIVRWLLLALLRGCLSAALHFTDVIPVNKSLWSLSFVILTTSIGLIVLTVCSIWRGGPFRIPDMNALVMYIGHHICHQLFSFRWTYYGEIKNIHTWRTIVALWDTATWTMIGPSLLKMSGDECNDDRLLIDEACLALNTNEHYNATLYSLSSDCYLCPFSKVSWIEQEKNLSIKLNTARAVTWRVYNDSRIEDFMSTTDESGIICQFQPNLGEYGIYELTIDKDACELHTIVEPSNSHIALAIIFGIVLCLLFGCSLVRSFVNYARERWQKGQAGASNDETPGRRRVLSIDTFRGISIVMMIFVNNGAGGYGFLEHATWNGLYVGDLIFPCFLWIMGFCIPISLSSQLAKGHSRFSMCRGILKRSILLFLIGVSLSTVIDSPDLKKIRIFGVLQRFGVAYFVIGVLYALMSRRREKKSENATSLKNTDFISLLPQWFVIIVIVAIHCGITFYLPVPGCPTGYLGPGGRHDDGKYFNCTGGAAGYIDRIILGANHIFRSPTIVQVYGSGPFDPEGILGCLTSIFQAFLGVQAGKIFKVHRGCPQRIVRWLILALLCGCLGAVLHFTNIIPVNKNLWSLSFVLLTTSFAQTLLSICYFLIDVKSIWDGGPFRIPGMNALVMYMGHQMCYKLFPFHWTYGAMESHTWKTIAALWDVAAWTIVGYLLHKRNIYITV